MKNLERSDFLPTVSDKEADRIMALPKKEAMKLVMSEIRVGPAK